MTTPKPNTWIPYIDARGFYSWAMMQVLPIDGFQWCATTLLEKILATPDDALKGFLIKVDLDYSAELHYAHSDYTLASDTLEVPETWLSDYRRTFVNELGGG